MPSLLTLIPLADPKQLSEALLKVNGDCFVSERNFIPTQYAFACDVQQSLQGSSFTNGLYSAQFDGAVNGTPGTAAFATLKYQLRSNSIAPNSIISKIFTLPVPAGSQNYRNLEIGTYIKSSMIGANVAATLGNIRTAEKANFASVLAGTAIADADGYSAGYGFDTNITQLSLALQEAFGSDEDVAVTFPGSIGDVNGDVVYTLATAGTSALLGENHVMSVLTRTSPILPEIPFNLGTPAQAGWYNAGNVNGLETDFTNAIVNAPIINSNVQLTGTGIQTATAKVTVYATKDIDTLERLSNSQGTFSAFQQQLLLGGADTAALEQGKAFLFRWFSAQGDPNYLLLFSVIFSTTKVKPNPAAIEGTEINMAVNPINKPGNKALFGVMAVSRPKVA